MSSQSGEVISPKIHAPVACSVVRGDALGQQHEITDLVNDFSHGITGNESIEQQLRCPQTLLDRTLSKNTLAHHSASDAESSRETG